MKRNSVFAAVCGAAAAHRLLSVGTLLCAAASVLASLLPPLLLARVIDDLAGGIPLTFAAALLYFGSLALAGVLTSGVVKIAGTAKRSAPTKADCCSAVHKLG